MSILIKKETPSVNIWTVNIYGDSLPCRGPRGLTWRRSMRNVTPRPMAAPFTVVAAAARGSRDEDGAPSPTAAMSRMTGSSSNDDLLVVPGAEAAMLFNSDAVDRVVD